MKDDAIYNAKIIAKEISKKSGVIAVVLFGSQVNGRAREDSDIDIVVITNQITSAQEADILGYSSDKLDISLFSRLPLIIQFRVVKEGKILKCNDKQNLNKIYIETTRKYLDYTPLLNKFYKQVLYHV
jgi:predicted nucleotidyltransferase